MSTRYSEFGWQQAAKIYAIYAELVPHEFKAEFDAKHEQFLRLAPRRGGQTEEMGDVPEGDWRQVQFGYENLTDPDS